MQDVVTTNKRVGFNPNNLLNNKGPLHFFLTRGEHTYSLYYNQNKIPKFRYSCVSQISTHIWPNYYARMLLIFKVAMTGEGSQ